MIVLRSQLIGRASLNKEIDIDECDRCHKALKEDDPKFIGKVFEDIGCYHLESICEHCYREIQTSD